MPNDPNTPTDVYRDLLSAVEDILNDEHMSQDHLARLHAAWEACPAVLPSLPGAVISAVLERQQRMRREARDARNEQKKHEKCAMDAKAECEQWEKEDQALADWLQQNGGGAVMRTIASLRAELAKFPDDAQCTAYEGEATGISIEQNGRFGFIYCGDNRPDRETELLQPLKTSDDTEGA